MRSANINRHIPIVHLEPESREAARQSYGVMVSMAHTHLPTWSDPVDDASIVLHSRLFCFLVHFHSYLFFHNFFS